jgi:predicted HAD superfamily Cof-like phosphohydrolase
MKFDEAWEKVAEFHRQFGHPVSDKPVLMDHDRAKKRYGWMLEELDEFIDSDTIVDQADAMIDLMYFALGTLVEMGVRPEKIFDIVHRANMAKIWPDGMVHHNETGKTIKPPSWTDPYEKIRSYIQEELVSGHHSN